MIDTIKKSPLISIALILFAVSAVLLVYALAKSSSQNSFNNYNYELLFTKNDTTTAALTEIYSGSISSIDFQSTQLPGVYKDLEIYIDNTHDQTLYLRVPEFRSETHTVQIRNCITAELCADYGSPEFGDSQFSNIDIEDIEPGTEIVLVRSKNLQARSTFIYQLYLTQYE